MTDQDSFKAILDHRSVTLWYLSSLAPHAVAGSRLHSFRWPEHPTSHPSRRLHGRTERTCSPNYLESCDGTWLPVGVPQELCIGEHHLGAGKTGICCICKQIRLHSICSHRPVQELKAGMKAEILISSCHGRSWTVRHRLRLPKI